MFRLAVAVLAVWLTKVVVAKARSLQSASRGLRACPNGGILWLHPFRSPSLVVGSWFPSPGQVGSWYGGFAPYARYGSTCIASVTQSGSIPTLWLVDADAIKTVTTESVLFQKDVEAYEALNFYGQNLVGTEGADWKRHRKVAKPAFNEAGNAFVWMETIRVINEWFMELDAVPVKRNTDAIAIDVVKDLVQVALLVISSAGFGRRASWQEDSTTTPPSGHKFAFRHAVTSATEHIHAKVLTPDWMYQLSERMHLPFIGPILKDTREAYDALKGHMLDLISLSRAWVVGGKVSNMDAGLLRNLVEANMMQEDDMHSTKSLTDDELLSNTFVFLLAGHETTAHSLSFAIALLALHPDVQNKIYEEALRLWPNAFPTTASASSYKDSMPNLQYTLAAFYETIRLFPPVIRLCKIAQADAHLTAHRFARNAKGEIANVEAFPVPVSAGSMVMIDIRGLGRNPMYWGSDCEDFKPERFVDTDSYRWPRDAFVSFSAGPRNCIGQRFATTESVCALASLVRNYEILIPDNLKGKSLDEQKASLLKWKPGATIVPTDCFVQLRRRPSV